MREPDVTILEALERSDKAAVEALLPLLYDELRAMASRLMAGSAKVVTVQPTSLVHEVYIRLSQGKELRFESVAHFKALCAKVMRGLLIDHCRRQHAIKRDGIGHTLTVATGDLGDGRPFVDVMDLDAVLSKLSEVDERKARIVELRFFGGLTNEQVATVMGLSRATISDEWRFTRAWMAEQLAGGDLDTG